MILFGENGKKRNYEDRKEILNNFLKDNKSRVIEGMSHSAWMEDLYDLCDYFFLLKISDFKAWGRIYKRFVKKKLKIEKGHKENLKYLRNLHRIRKKYKKETLPEIKQTMEKYKEKSFVVKNLKCVERIIENSAKN